MPEIGDSNYEERFDLPEQFTIEFSIPMRKPKNHMSRASGVVLDILKTHKGGTFFEAKVTGKGFRNQ